MTDSDRTSKLHNSTWNIVSFKQPFLWVRSIGENGQPDETWSIRPPERYVLNAEQLVSDVRQYVSSLSDLNNAAFYHPLRGSVNLAGANLLVERFRERGLGDLMFMTGPLNFLRYLSGGSLNVFFYALSDRGPLLQEHPSLFFKTPCYGPVTYDSFPRFNYHWMVDSVTEYDEEPEQLNVYDALFRQIGVDPESVDPVYKRPSLALNQQDQEHLDSLLYFVYSDRKIDLRKTGYYVVAPLSHSSLRSSSYTFWLKVIQELATRRPVLVIGHVVEQMPVTDMSVGEFAAQLQRLGKGVISLIGGTPIRLMMAAISKSVTVVGLDSAPIYIAQSFRVPAISIWGTHDPAVRLGYDKDYMDLAIFEKRACRHAPCFAYKVFPENKCPRKANQQICEVLASTDPSAVIEKLNAVEGARRTKPIVVSQPAVS